MAQVYLIDRYIIANFFQLAEFGEDDALLLPHIVTAQNLDIKPALGVVFFTDLIANYLEANYQKLLKGDTYTFEGESYEFVGLEPAIAAYTMARRRRGSASIDSPFGLVTKESQFSQPADSKAVAASIAEAQEIGIGYLDQAITYLNHNASLFPKWEVACDGNVKKTRRFSISAISRFDEDDN
jgi:hypothetical protein